MSLSACSGYIVANTCAVAIFLPSRSHEMRRVCLLMGVGKNYARPLADTTLAHNLLSNMGNVAFIRGACMRDNGTPQSCVRLQLGARRSYDSGRGGSDALRHSLRPGTYFPDVFAR